MSKQYDDTNRGALFKNDKKETENHPDYKGNVNVDGVEFWLSAWIKEDKNGHKYMSLSVQPKEKGGTARKPQQGRNDRDTADVPF